MEIGCRETANFFYTYIIKTNSLDYSIFLQSNKFPNYTIDNKMAIFTQKATFNSL